MMDTHPQRCDTCKNLNCQRHGIHNLYPRECGLVTETVGCASHSDFTAEPKPWVTAYQEGVLKGISTERENVLVDYKRLSECIKKHWGERHEAPVYQYNKLVKTLDEFEARLINSKQENI
jgi:hypothetical protein